MMNSVYKVLTPAGQFDAIFAEDDDIQIEYSGDELAIDFFKDWLFINQISGEHGRLLDSLKLTPNDLYGFCQPLNSGIEVIPPFDDLMSYTQEDIAMQNNETVTDGEVLDGVYSDADKKSIAATNQLIKYFREFIASDFEKAKVPTSIYGWTATGQVMDKEDAKRKLRELIDIAINRKAGIEDITPKQKQRLADYQHDARVISDYLTKRIRHTGARNLLRTPEMKAKFPDIDNQPREEFDSVIVNDEIKKIADMVLDGISGMDKIKLIKEAGSIRVNLQTAQSGMEKLKMVKRIKEIRDALGVGSAGGLDKNGLDADGMWPMTSAEYNKIHSDYKGAFPDGTPTALKLINGATTIVPVRITDKTAENPNIGRTWHDGQGDEIKIESYADGKYFTLRNGRIGGAPIIPEDQLEKTIEVDTNWYQHKLKTDADMLAAEQEAARLAAEREAEYADITGDPMQKGRKIAALSRQVRMSDGRVLTIKKLVEERVSSGDTVETKSFFNAQAGKALPERVLMKPDGQTFRDQKSIGKIGLDYAEELIAKRDADRQENSEGGAATMVDVNNVMPLLKKFIGAAQLSVIGSSIRGEEGQFFKDKMVEIANVIQTMPKTYGQDGMGDKAIVYLHYFKGSGDWYITEKDMEDDQIQAFGLADIFGDGGELGYINIEEIIQHGVELDFHWTPKTLGQIRGTSGEDETQGAQAGDESSEINDPTETTATSEDALQEDDAKSGFISELKSLKAETDINRFNERLDEVAARVEQAGLMDALDKELNDAADVLTALLSAAESGGK